jgi:sugar phosphate isomerase/epimerase
VACGSSSARAWERLPRGADAWSVAGREGIRGVTIGPIENSLFPGRGYGTPSTAALLDHLSRQGVNWVSITPFGRIWDLRSTRIDLEFEAPWEDNRRAIRELVEQAHARGIRVLLIPHLWVETSGWRGEIDPGSPQGWAAYHAAYRGFVTTWAREAAAAGVDALSIGVECKSWSGRFGPVWRALIADVRAAFPGLLTYSANWDEAEDVLFWDQLDLVGINAFYPLSNHAGSTFEEYVEGANQARERVGDLARVLEMPVVFVEVGYTTRRDAAVEPWLWPDDMQGVVIDEREQARALLASFRGFLPEPWFTGFFVWRYYADLDDVSQEAEWGFSPHGKRAARVLTRTYASQWGVDPQPYGLERGPEGSWEASVAMLERWTRSTVVARPPTAVRR